MKVCLVCKAECDDAAELCPVCGADLTAEITEEEEKEAFKRKFLENYNSNNYDDEYEEEMEYKIVGSSEANSLKGKISNESPVGHALLGHKVGDEVTVETQAGEIHYKVLSIHRSN